MAVYRPRVLMVLDELCVGGTETHVLSITRELMKNDIHVVVCAAEGDMLNDFLQVGCPVYLINFLNKNKAVEESTTDAGHMEDSMIEMIKEIIQKEHVNLIHAHQKPSGLFVCKVAKLLGIPFILTVHGLYYSESTLSSFTQYGATTIAVSPPVQKKLKSHNIESILIPNGIDTSIFHPNKDINSLRRSLGISKKSPIVVYVGRLTSKKAAICKKVIKACRALRKKELKSLQLIIAGNGVNYNELENYVRQTELKTKSHFIHIIGLQKDMSSIYSAADCIIGTGRVALEAMACERPVIAIGTKGFMGLVIPRHFEKAWQQYFGDHAADFPCLTHFIQQALINVLSVSNSMSIFYGIKNREFIKEKFNIIQVAKQTIDVYTSVLERFQI